MIWLAKLYRDHDRKPQLVALEYSDEQTVTASMVADEANEGWVGTYTRVDVALMGETPTADKWDRFDIVPERVEPRKK